MKNVGIFVDFLIEKNETTFILEQLVALYDDVTLYTLSHQEGKLQAPIELNPIRSTYLSSKIKTPEDIKKHFYLIPHARKTLVPQKKHEAVIIFNNGNLSHLAIDGSLYNLKIELNFINQNDIPETGWKSRLFKSFFDQSTAQDKFSPLTLKMEYQGEEKVLEHFNFCADFTEFNLSKERLREQGLLSSYFSENKISELLDILTEFQNCSGILPSHCSDKELASKFNSAYFLLINGVDDYLIALKAKASGLLVYNCDPKSRDFFDSISISSLNMDNLEEELKEVVVKKHRIDQDKLRREALKFNAQNFKRIYLKRCEKLFQEFVNPKQVTQSFHSH